MPPLKIFFSRRKMTRTLILAVVLLPVSIVCIESSVKLIQAIGLVWFVLWALLVIVAVASLLSRKPVLVLDGQGLCDRRIMKAPIPWSLISGANIVRHKNRRKLEVVAHSPIAAAHFKFIFRKSSVRDSSGAVATVLIDLEQLDFDEGRLLSFLSDVLPS